MLYEIKTYIKKTGFVCFIFFEDQIYQITEENLSLKDKVENLKEKYGNDAYAVQYNGTEFVNKAKINFASLDDAIKFTLDLIHSEMSIRNDVLSDKNSLYLKLFKEKNKLDDLQLEIASLKEEVSLLKETIQKYNLY